MNHYDDKYFEWQKSMGLLGARLNKFMFEKHVTPNDRLLDFGCGGGFLLSELNAGEKIGVEINPAGRENALKLGINTVESLAGVQDEWATIAISNHALEHVDQPLDVLKELSKKLKPKSKVIFVTPFERTNKYLENDINFHLYTWSPMNIGNLFNKAGFKVIKAHKVSHKWPPKFEILIKILGFNAVHYLSRVYGFLNRSQTQVRIVAQKF